MKSKRIISLFMAAIIVISLSACGKSEKAPQPIADGAVEKELAPDSDINDTLLRDNKLLYEAYDPTEIVTMYLTVSSGNSAENTDHTWKEVNTYSVYDYERMGVDRYKVQGLLQVGEELGYNLVSPNCTVQIRGQSSSEGAQKNYKIKIKDNKGSWRGQTTIALNKHQSDGLRFRNKMAYDLMAGIDEMMGLRTTFVHLYVKDTTAGGNNQFTDYGIYTQVEQLNKTALKAHGLDKNAHLYKINLFEFYRYEDVIKLDTDPDYDETAFETLIETKGNTDHTKLIELLEKLNDFSIPIDDIIEEHLCMENLSYWMAFQILMGNVDTQSRNFYIYSPLNSQKWYILSWDNDASLKRNEYDLLNWNDYNGWEKGISNYWGNVLFQRCLKSKAFRKALDDAINELRKYLTPKRINDMADKYASVVRPYVYKMPEAMYAPLTQAQYAKVLSSLGSELELCYDMYLESLKTPMPFFIATPVKTKDGKLSVTWDSSYDFNAETVTYTAEIARDSSFRSIIAKEENLLIPAIETDMLPAGQYFVRVTSTNESGYTQYAFDYYHTEAGKVYGTKCFYIDRSGKILEDE